MNRSEVPTLEIPKYQLNFLFPQIEFTLEEVQYRNLMEMIERFALYQKGLKVSEFSMNFLTYFTYTLF